MNIAVQDEISKPGCSRVREQDCLEELDSCFNMKLLHFPSPGITAIIEERNPIKGSARGDICHHNLRKDFLRSIENLREQKRGKYTLSTMRQKLFEGTTRTKTTTQWFSESQKSTLTKYLYIILAIAMKWKSRSR